MLLGAVMTIHELEEVRLLGHGCGSCCLSERIISYGRSLAFDKARVKKVVRGFDEVRRVGPAQVRAATELVD